MPSQLYKNEEIVGNAVKYCGIAREDLFLTTKIWFTRFSDGNCRKSLEESLKKLSTDYLDLVVKNRSSRAMPQYFTAITHGGNFQMIEDARKDLLYVMWFELRQAFEFQFVFTLVEKPVIGVPLNAALSYHPSKS